MTAADFFDKLQQDQLDNSSAFSITGMVKKVDGKEKAIQFAPGGHCSNWVTIPLEYIEDVHVIRTVPCKDHSHPFVQLNLKAPRTPEAKIFAAILQGMHSNTERMQQGFEQPQPGWEGMPGPYALRQARDKWGDPICGGGTRKKCGPAICPNPSGVGTIWCTECWCEPVFNPGGYSVYF